MKEPQARVHVTPLFEIIYPDNRVVVDYGSMRSPRCPYLEAPPTGP
jgi:hypothetical protein